MVQQSENSPENETELYEERLVPLLLEGVWENSGRYILFDTGYASRNNIEIPQIVLKTYYGWYNDRSAESSDYTKENPRSRNIANSYSGAQELEIRFHPLTQQCFTKEYNLPVYTEDGKIITALDNSSGAWDMEIFYPHFKESFHVPVCVIGNNLYLNFIIKDTNQFNENASFWRDQGNASGILISPPVSSRELTSYLVTEDAVYHIRYWRTDMEHDGNAKASFSDGSETFYVPKHIKVGEENFTCVNGRGSKIRNIEKSSDFSSEYVMNSLEIENLQEKTVTQESTICAFGKPYLVLEETTRTLEQILAEESLRKKSAPPYPFPPHGILDLDWAEIEERMYHWLEIRMSR